MACSIVTKKEANLIGQIFSKPGRKYKRRCYLQQQQQQVRDKRLIKEEISFGKLAINSV